MKRLLLGLLTLTTACGGVEQSNPTTQTDLAAAHDYDFKGRHYRYLGAPTVPISSLGIVYGSRATRESHIQALRPIVIRHDGVYQGDADPRDGASWSPEFAKEPKVVKLKTDMSATVLTRLLDSNGQPSRVGIIGNDERVLVSLSYLSQRPYVSVVAIGMSGAYPGAPYNDVICSGTYVGPHILVTAAHCVWDAPEAGWWRDPVFTVLGSFQGQLYPTGACWHQMTFPGGYGGDGDVAYDYAAIDYTGCTDNLGDITGYMSMWLNHGSISGSQFSTSGYPEFCGASGYLYEAAQCMEDATSTRHLTKGSGPLFTTPDLDLTHGMSGGPLYFPSGAQNYLIGVAVANDAQGFNYFHAMDTAFFNLAGSITNDF